MQQGYTISPLGDGALLVSFGNVIDEKSNERVLKLYQKLKGFSSIRDVVPAYSSLAVYYDALAFHRSDRTTFEQVSNWLTSLLKDEEAKEIIPTRHFTIPVCYALSFAPDLEEMAAQKRLSVEAIIQLHTAKTYRVYTIGFQPGFPYMGTVDERLATPRRSSPRAAVPAGSVGIAGAQTGIYPFTSPGGWNIIGRTPVLLFNIHNDPPALLQPGDTASFISITEDAFEDYQGGIA